MIYISVAIQIVSCSDPDLSDIELRLEDVDNRIDSLNLRSDSLDLRLDSIAIQLETLQSGLQELKSEGKLNHLQYSDYLTFFIQMDSVLKNASQAEKVEMISEIDSVKEELNILSSTNTYQELSGSIEKGPFLRGSRLFIYEMDTSFAQTGRTFTADIRNDLGDFGLTAINLLGKNCLVVGTGFYYNEVSNSNSNSSISLSAMVRIDSGEVINVNVLTHLERRRVEYLIKQGASYDSAKRKALTEVLNFFGISNSGWSRAEKIGLNNSNDESSILLSISVLLQGFRTESQLVDILSKFSLDIESDGIVNDSTVGNSIMSHLYYMNQDGILNQLKSKYSGIISESALNSWSLGSLSDFEQNTEFVLSEKLITYPEKSDSNSPNVLHPSYSGTSSFVNVSAFLSPGTVLKVVILDENGETPSNMSFQLGSDRGWTYSTQPDFSLTGVFESSTAGLNSIDLTMPAGNYTVIAYEKGGAVETFRKDFSK